MFLVFTHLCEVAVIMMRRYEENAVSSPGKWGRILWDFLVFFAKGRDGSV